jgi:hypothetical protein
VDPDLSPEDAALLAEMRGRKGTSWRFTYDSDSGTWTGLQVLRSFTASTLQELKQAIDDDYRDRYWGVEP